MGATRRGAFIVFEGCDRSGKSTQSRLLVDYLKKQQISAKLMAFPARESNIGQMINSYLTNKQELSDEVIHLLFSTNRWEYKKAIVNYLNAGITLVVDRYSYSGVAYSVAKGLNYEWCYAPERGLICPDAVFYLKAASTDELTARGQYGEERYEKREFQTKVADVFNRINAQESKYWHALDACQPVEQLQQQISDKVKVLLKQVAQKPLEVLT